MMMFYLYFAADVLNPANVGNFSECNSNLPCRLTARFRPPGTHKGMWDRQAALCDGSSPCGRCSTCKPTLVATSVLPVNRLAPRSVVPTKIVT